MIVYKVVEKKTRHCSNWTMAKFCYLGNERKAKALARLRKRYPQLFPRYIKGSIVKAAPNTPGVFCCKTYKGAKIFMDDSYPLSCRGKIIKVRGIGPPLRRKNFIVAGAGNPEHLVLWYNTGKYETMKIEKTVYSRLGVDFIRFKAVEVLE